MGKVPAWSIHPHLQHPPCVDPHLLNLSLLSPIHLKSPLDNSSRMSHRHLLCMNLISLHFSLNLILILCFLTSQMKITICKVTQTRDAESSSPHGSTSTLSLDIISSCIQIFLYSLYSILAYVPALDNFQFCTELQSGSVLHYPPTTLVL